MKIIKYQPFAFVYFFINGLGLPLGLLYTTLLTPVFYIWLVLQKKRLIVTRFVLISVPFVCFHLYNGVDLSTYIKSAILFFCVYIFCYAFYTLTEHQGVIEKIIKRITTVNFAFLILAVAMLFTPVRPFLWNDWTFFSTGITLPTIPRLKMLTYEPSYYATLLVPLFSYYFIRFILKQTTGNRFSHLLVIGLPLLMSLSFGVISCFAISITLLILLNFTTLFSSKKIFNSFIALGILLLIGIIFLYIFYPNNPIFVRAIAFISNDDQSGRGRTTEAFHLAYQIAEVKSIWWGVGPGQLKIVGDPIIKEFYAYGSSYGQVSIPNAVAETLTLFGFVGVGLRISIQLYLFFRTKVLNNYFQTLLFLYAFIYQFTGSFTTNVAEYVIWILAFTNVFPQFDKQNSKINLI